MSVIRNAHRVFHDAPSDEDFLNAITVEETEVESLRSARDKIRRTLKDGFRNWETQIKKVELLAQIAQSIDPRTVNLEPKFRMQGSMSYRTLNDPARHPPQQIDVDDGMYLPTSFLNEGRDPIIAFQGYFAAVERMLQPLCVKKGWKLVEKDTCVRVVLSKKAHVDLALYAIPDSEFTKLVEAVEAMARTQNTFGKTFDAAAGMLEIDGFLYDQIPEDQIMLAHRKEGWKRSDPRKLERWFAQAISDHGQQLRRICRYLKAWRDFRWLKPDLSSIAIMKCVIDAYDALGETISESRDDIALLKITERLPTLLEARVRNPVVDGAYLDEGWAHKRGEIVASFRELHNVVGDALTAQCTSADVISKLRASFGARIPNDVSLIRAETEADAVMAYPPVYIIREPEVRTTKSG